MSCRCDGAFPCAVARADTAAPRLSMVLQSRGTTPDDVSGALLYLEPVCARLCAARPDRLTEVVPALRAAIEVQQAQFDDVAAPGDHPGLTGLGTALRYIIYMFNVAWRGMVRETAGVARLNNKVYIHEFIDIIDIIGHNRAKYMHHMTANFSPRAQIERGQLCYGVWGVLGTTRRWPEVVNIWEEVLREVAGYGAERLERLRAAGVLG